MDGLRVERIPTDTTNGARRPGNPDPQFQT
jgi:hypothetical protein